MNKVQREVFRRRGCFFLEEKVPTSLPCLEVIARSCDNFSGLSLRISQNKGERLLVRTVAWGGKKEEEEKKGKKRGEKVKIQTT
jgi:hypothetical protein